MATRKNTRAGKAPSRPSHRRPARARKLKLIEIDGHLLTPELHDEYQRRLEWRRDTNSGVPLPASHIAQMALSDVLAKFQFSMRAKEVLHGLYDELQSVAFAVAAFDGYPFYRSSGKPVRLAGCDALNRLAAEAQLLGAKIHAIGEAIRYEDREHLQDWQKRQAAYDSSSVWGAAPTVSAQQARNTRP
jgi:hypothetical protein